MKKRVGINGFGRIGRLVLRAFFQGHYENLQLVAVNSRADPETNLHMFKYDSTYGTFEGSVTVGSNSLYINGHELKNLTHEEPKDIPWKEHDVDIVIDSSGIHDNVINSYKLLKQGIKRVIITYSPNNFVDHTIIIGVNENSFDKSKHNIISSSICDANACAPVLNILDEEFGITDGFITTLHPWLGYQNLLDGSLKSVSSPGHYWSDFALGRSSTDSLIPKPTSLVSALQKVLPACTNNIYAMSMRVPTSIVSATDMVLSLDKRISIKAIEGVFQQLEYNYPEIVKINRESLVSIDFKGIKQSCVIDLRWLQIFNNKMKLVLWYDNEWGYSNRVIDLVNIIYNT